MKRCLFGLTLIFIVLPSCIVSPGIFTEISRIYSPDSTKFLLKYTYMQGAWDGDRSHLIAILKITDSVKSSVDKYRLSSLDIDDIYWQDSNTVIIAEKYAEFISNGKSSFEDGIFQINSVTVKVVQKDPIDSSYKKKILYRETSPNQKHDLIIYRYGDRDNLLNISIINKNDSIPKYGNFYITKYGFDCFTDIRWNNGDTLDIKVSKGCYYAFADYLVRNKPDIRYKIQINDTIQGNIQ